MAAFALELDEVLSQKIAASRAPVMDATAAMRDTVPTPPTNATTAPGG